EKHTGATRVSHFGFAATEWPALQRQGNAFGNGPFYEAPANQQEIFGHEGPFASSFPLPGGDGPTGTLRLPLTIQGDALTFRIGGGRDPEHERVSLLVDGKVVASATGCNSEMLGRRAWNLRPYKGKQAIVELADTSTGGWGHLMVDEIEEWRLP